MAATASGGGRLRPAALLAAGRWHVAAATDVVVGRLDPRWEFHERGVGGDAHPREDGHELEQQRHADDDQQRDDAPGDDDRPEDPFVERENPFGPLTVTGLNGRPAGRPFTASWMIPVAAV